MKHIELLLERYPALTVCEDAIRSAVGAIIGVYENGGKLLLCGNGGSCADCDHIAGELMKGFLKKRPLPEALRSEMQARCHALDDGIFSKLQGGLPAISIPQQTALGTAFANDQEPRLAFAQATLALGRAGDALMAISTSGNAENVVLAAKVAKGLGMTVLALTGEGGGALAEIADVSVCVPARETFMVQELHLPVYHAICAEIENAEFDI